MPSSSCLILVYCNVRVHRRQSKKEAFAEFDILLCSKNAALMSLIFPCVERMRLNYFIISLRGKDSAWSEYDISLCGKKVAWLKLKFPGVARRLLKRFY